MLVLKQHCNMQTTTAPLVNKQMDLPLLLTQEKCHNSFRKLPLFCFSRWNSETCLKIPNKPKIKASAPVCFA